MGLSTWLKERRLERTHQKLKRLRSLQSRLRDEEADLDKSRKAGAPAAELDAKKLRIHEERERITKEIGVLSAEEDALKAELKAAA